MAAVGVLARGALAAPRASSADLPARLTVTAPDGTSADHPGFFAWFSEFPPPTEALRAWQPVASDPMGCDGSSLPAAPSGRGAVIAVLRRGKCSFVEKAVRAQVAGAAGLLIVSDTEDVWPPEGGNDGNTTSKTAALSVHIPVAMLRKSDGDQILEWVSAQGLVTIGLSIMHLNILNFSEALLVCLATFLVVAGAHFATADLRVDSPIAPRHHEEVVTLNNEFAFGFCVMGSVMLVVLYFLMRYMISGIILAFCIGGFGALAQISAACLGHLAPNLKRRTWNVPVVGELAFNDILGAIPAATVVLIWVPLRNLRSGWICQDLIGAGILCFMQRTLRLPNIKVATLLLSVMFFFDIFWVFISPLIFEQSVMVAVATGGGTGETVPMLLRIPSFDPLGSDRMLGFGDVALPGLLVSYLRRFDLLGRKSGCRRGYFLPSVAGYFCGLCVTLIALSIMRKGQPALLYLVPCTLGTTLVLGKLRGELSDLWSGKPQCDSSTLRYDAEAADGHLQAQLS